MFKDTINTWQLLRILRLLWREKVFGGSGLKNLLSLILLFGKEMQEGSNRDMEKMSPFGKFCSSTNRLSLLHFTCSCLGWSFTILDGRASDIKLFTIFGPHICSKVPTMLSTTDCKDSRIRMVFTSQSLVCILGMLFHRLSISDFRGTQTTTALHSGLTKCLEDMMTFLFIHFNLLLAFGLFGSHHYGFTAWIQE